MGLAPHCKDTFFGRCRLRVWQVDSAGRRSASPLIDASSTTAALEVRAAAGGPGLARGGRQSGLPGSPPALEGRRPTLRRTRAHTRVHLCTTAMQVGGGPWWSTWSARADMKEPFRSLVQLPIDVGAIAAAVPQPLRPPGL
jgi:tocopherol cyclase